jgi:hypothetical protein
MNSLATKIQEYLNTSPSLDEIRMWLANNNIGKIDLVLTIMDLLNQNTKPKKNTRKKK